MNNFEPIKSKKKCRKVRFRDEYGAKKRGRQIGLRAYYCKGCDGFHLTSEDKGNA